MSLISQGWQVSDSVTGPPYGVKKYVEASDSGSCSLSPDNSSFNHVYQVDDDQRLAFMDALLGVHFYVNEAAGDLTISRAIPEEDREAISFFCSELTGKRVNSRSIAPVTGISTWKYTSVDAAFRPADYAILDDGTMLGLYGWGNLPSVPGVELNRYVSRTYNYVAEYLSGGFQRYKFCGQTGAENIINEIPGIISAYLELEYIWHYVPARIVPYDGYTLHNVEFTPPNIRTISSLLGTVNCFAFDTYPPGTCLFTGARANLRKPNLATGLYTWDICYRFIVKDQGDSAYSTPLGGFPFYPTTTQVIRQGPNFIFNAGTALWDLPTAARLDPSGLYQTTGDAGTPTGTPIYLPLTMRGNPSYYGQSVLASFATWGGTPPQAAGVYPSTQPFPADHRMLFSMSAGS